MPFHGEQEIQAVPVGQAKLAHEQVRFFGSKRAQGGFGASPHLKSKGGEARGQGLAPTNRIVMSRGHDRQRGERGAWFGGIHRTELTRVILAARLSIMGILTTGVNTCHISIYESQSHDNKNNIKSYIMVASNGQNEKSILIQPGYVNRALLPASG